MAEHEPVVDTKQDGGSGGSSEPSAASSGGGSALQSLASRGYAAAQQALRPSAESSIGGMLSGVANYLTGGGEPEAPPPFPLSAEPDTALGTAVMMTLRTMWDVWMEPERALAQATSVNSMVTAELPTMAAYTVPMVSLAAARAPRDSLLPYMARLEALYLSRARVYEQSRELERRMGKAEQSDEDTKAIATTVTSNQQSIETANLKKARDGYYIVGSHNPADLIEAEKDQLGLSDKEGEALANVSRSEGNADAVNTWDEANISFGFIQFAGGKNRGLRPMMAMLKNNYPAAFDACFLQYGIDVTYSISYADDDPKKENPEYVDPLLVVADDKGKVHTGTDAEVAIKKSRKLTEAFVAAGANPDVQRAQAEAAAALYVRPSMEAKGAEYDGENVPMGEIFTSAEGIELVIDRGVQEGVEDNKRTSGMARLQKAIDHVVPEGKNPRDYEAAIMAQVETDAQRDKDVLSALQEAIALVNGVSAFAGANPALFGVLYGDAPPTPATPPGEDAPPGPSPEAVATAAVEATNLTTASTRIETAAGKTTTGSDFVKGPRARTPAAWAAALRTEKGRVDARPANAGALVTTFTDVAAQLGRQLPNAYSAGIHHRISEIVARSNEE